MRQFLFPAALLLTFAGPGCRPTVDDPPTKIEDPDAELGAAKKKADQNKKKDKNKSAKDGKDARAKVDPAPQAPPSVEAKVGEKAPSFELKDLEGRAVRLEALAGKTVVLEWFNPECPFVKYAHGEGGPLRTLAAEYMDKDVVWLSINSGAPGKQGHGADTNQKGVADYAMKNPVLLDESGEVGRRYGAKTTPHIFVIGPDQKLAYAGGLDNAPRGDVQGDALIPYAVQAIDAVLAGEAPPRNETQPYGCSVKYAG